MKKVIVILLSLSLLLSLVACGGGQEKTEDGKVIVTMWRHEGTPTESDYYDMIVEKFNSLQDEIELQAIALPDNTYLEQVNAAILSGDLPDVLDLDGPQMAGFAHVGALAPLDSYITDDLKKDLLPSILDQGRFEDGKIYALGQFESGLSFWGNKSLLEAAEVRIPTIDNPWDQAEFLAALESLSKVEGIEYPLDLKVNYGSGYWVYSYLPWVASFGGDFIDRDTYQAVGTMNGEGTVKAFEFLKELVDAGYVDANQSTDDDFYGSRKSALALVGHWMYPPHTSEEALGEDAILLPFPNFGKGVKTGSGSWAWSMTSAAADHGVSEETWQVIDFLLSEEALMDIFDANGAVPSRVSVLDQIDEFKEGGVLYLYRQQLEEGLAYVRPITPSFGVIQSTVGEAAINIMKGSDVMEELTKAAEEIDETIEENKYHK